MRYTVKEIYNNNAPCTYGIFPTVVSQFTGTPFVRFGTAPVDVLETWKDANDVCEALNIRASGKKGGIG